MKRLIKQITGSSKGFSLTEVLIAIVILGLAGATIINGMTTDTKVRGKTNTATNVSVGLNAAAEVILASNVSLIPCRSASFTPPDAEGNRFPIVYKNAITSLPSVKVVLVEALTRDASPTWVNCAGRDTPVDSAAQRITLQAINAGTTMQKIILKTSATNSDSDSVSVARPFLITASKSEVKIAAAGDSTCGSWDTLNLSNSLGSNSIVYSAISADSTKISSSISGSSLTVSGIAAGSSAVTIQGINASNGVTSNTIIVNATVLAPISFITPNIQISVVNPNGRVINGLLAISGGSISTKSISSQTLSITGTSYSFDARQITSPNTYTNAISITDPGLPNASTCTSPSWKVPIKVQRALEFTFPVYNPIDSNTSLYKCIVGSNISCSIPINVRAGTGSEDSRIAIKYQVSATGCLSLTDISNLKFGASGNDPALIGVMPVAGTNDYSKIQVVIESGTKFYTEFESASTVNFTYTGTDSKSYSVLSWGVKVYNKVEAGNKFYTYLYLENPGSRAEGLFSNKKSDPNPVPKSINIAILNSINPKILDPNYTSSMSLPAILPAYESTAQQLLDRYCS